LKKQNKTNKVYFFLFVLQKGFDVTQQKEIDDFLLQQDGTDNKSIEYH